MRSIKEKGGGGGGKKGIEKEEGVVSRKVRELEY